MSVRTRIILPVWGTLLYIILYLIAAGLYPGGSDIDKTSRGFSWLHNYWCELMASVAQNGEANRARVIAITAMFVLAISLGLFWYYVPLLFSGNRKGSLIMRYCGIGSMMALPLFFTGNHDLTINIAGVLGCTAIIILLVNLFYYRYFFAFGMGIACLLLCGLNNYVYYYHVQWMYYLPVIQKISFAVFLAWFCLLSISNYLRWKI